jgi:hypothetical protein
MKSGAATCLTTTFGVIEWLQWRSVLLTPAAAQPTENTITVCLFPLHALLHGCIQAMTGLMNALTPAAAQVASGWQR